MDRDWHVSETLFKDLGLDPLSNSSSIEKAEIVTCPEEFVETGLRVKTWKDNNGQVERFQPINMKNPISGMSISGDEGKTWAKMSQFGNTDSFLRPSSLSSETSKLLLRVESWMGGSDVLVRGGPDSIWSADQDAVGGGNNICRGIFKLDTFAIG